MREPDPEQAAERARAGVRAWVRDAGRRTRARVRSASPYAILAFLTASAVAPIAGAGLGASAEFTAALDQLGGVGSNFLSDALAGTARKLRESDQKPSEEEWRDAIAADLLPRLAAADDQGRALHEEISRVLREVDAVGTAISEAAVTDEELRHILENAFQELGLGVSELRWMLTDVQQSVDGLRQQLAQQSLSLHQQLDEVRRHLYAFTREQLPPDDPVPADVPPGAVPPYPGLASFQPEDAPWFRGREPQVAELLGRVAEQAVGGPPLIITGVSGAGKSSLVRAGLLPGIAGGTLGTEAAAWPWILTNPGVRPLADLERRLRSVADVDGEEPYGLGDLAARAAAEGRRPVIVVDQFEELFTQCPDPAERLAYVTALTNAAPALVVIAVRSDFYPACVELPPLAKVLAAGHVVLGPLDADAIRRAVVEPAEQAGLSVEPGLPDLLLRDLGADGRDGYEPGALPLLAHALRATWDRREGARLTVGAYQATGGIRHAVADTAEKIYVELSAEDRERLRSALLALVTVTSNGTVVRRRGERAAADSRVLRRLVKARLVTVGTETVEISHEALLTSWPRLAGWLAEAREDLLLRQQVTSAAEDWSRSGRDPDLLLRGSRLLAARERVPDGEGVPPVVGEFLAAGWAAAEQEEDARRRGTRRLRQLVAGLGVALLLAVGGGLVALDQREEAVANSRVAESRQFAAEALGALQVDDESAAVRKSLDAWQSARTAEARSALLSTQAVSFAGRLGTEPGGWSAAVSPDGSRIAVGSGDGTAQIWDARTFTPTADRLAYPQKVQVSSVAFSPDGRFLATGALTRSGVKIWDATTGRLLRTLRALGAVAWLPGTTSLIAARQTNGLPLGRWNVETGRMTPLFPVGPSTGMDLAVSPDGRFVAESGPNRGAQVWRLSDGVQVMTAPDALHVAFAPDGTLVTSRLTEDNQGKLTHWEVPSGRQLREITPATTSTPPPRPLTVTADGMVITGGLRRTAALWSLTSDVTGSLNTGQATFGAGAASANGQLVVVTAPDAPTVVYRRVVNMLNTDGPVNDVAFSPDGRRFAAGGTDGKVRIWDTATRELITTLRPTGVVSALGYAAGGVLAVATFANTLEIWNENGRLQVPAKLVTGPKDLAVSRDGNLVAVSVGQDVGGEANTVPSSVEVYDLRKQRFLGSIPLGYDTAYAIAFSADGATLHTAATIGYLDKTVNRPSLRSELRSWRTSDLSGIGSLDLGRNQVLDLAVAPDGQSIALAGTDRRIEIRTATGAESRWQSDAQPGQVSGIAFAPDGQTLVSTDIGGLVRLWDVRSHEVAATLQGHTNTVAALAFSPDGALLASGGTDTQVGVWSLDPAVAVHRLCQIAVPLSRTEGTEVSPLCR